jgi:hypothetical protein
LPSKPHTIPNFASEGIVGCIIGLSLVFGLLSIVILLGYGIIQIPVSYLKYASNYRKLRYMQYKAAEYDAKQRSKLSKVQEMVNLSNMIKVKHENEPHRKVILSDVGISSLQAPYRSNSFKHRSSMKVSTSPTTLRTDLRCLRSSKV